MTEARKKMSVARERSSAMRTQEPGTRYIVNEAGEKERVIPVDVYERLVEAWEDLEDIRAYDEAKAEGGEGVALEQVKRELGLSD